MVLPHGSSSVHLSVPSFPSFSCTTEAPLPVFFPFLVEKEQINKPTNGICAYVWMSFIVGRLLHSHIPPHPYLRHMIDLFIARFGCRRPLWAAYRWLSDETAITENWQTVNPACRPFPRIFLPSQIQRCHKNINVTFWQTSLRGRAPCIFVWTHMGVKFKIYWLKGDLYSLTTIFHTH